MITNEYYSLVAFPGKKWEEDEKVDITSCGYGMFRNEDLQLLGK